MKVYTNIMVEDSEKIRIIRIAKESNLNPLDIETLEEIKDAIEGSDGRIIVIRGSDRAFSAGANIKKFEGLDDRGSYDMARRGHIVMDFIASYGRPVIAAINGFALGGGFELALACDIRIASPETKLGLTETNLGILPGWGGTQRLKSMVGITRAFEMISMGKMITAEEAFKLGIVNSITPQYFEEALKIAEEYSNRAMVAISYVKDLMNRSGRDGFELEKEKFGLVFRTEDHREGVKAFVEKRKPSYHWK
ncbi:MAG: enoyl-CoA hydratase-related protein [Thermoplasmataceae archaeon]